MANTYSQMHIQVVFAVKYRGIDPRLVGGGALQVHHGDCPSQRPKNAGHQWHARPHSFPDRIETRMPTLRFGARSEKIEQCLHQGTRIFKTCYSMAGRIRSLLLQPFYIGHHHQIHHESKRASSQKVLQEGIHRLPQKIRNRIQGRISIRLDRRRMIGSSKFSWRLLHAGRGWLQHRRFGGTPTPPMIYINLWCTPSRFTRVL